MAVKDTPNGQMSVADSMVIPEVPVIKQETPTKSVTTPETPQAQETKTSPIVKF